MSAAMRPVLLLFLALGVHDLKLRAE